MSSSSMPPVSNSTDESSAQYGSFVRSGSFPILVKKLGPVGEALVRVGSSAALAFLMGGAGYALTQWLVPTHGAQIASAADLSPVEAMQIRSGAVRKPIEVAKSEELSAPLHMASVARNVNAPRSHDGSGRKTVKRRTGDMAEVSVGASAGPEPLPVAGNSAELDMLSQEGLRTQLIADRVRALDEANQHAANANTLGSTATAAAIGELPAEPDSLDLEDDEIARNRRKVRPKETPTEVHEVHEEMARAEPAPTLEQAAPALKPNPAPARVPALQLRAAANIEDLSVRGSLSASNVRRGVERLRPALAACYEHAAQQAHRNSFGRVELSVTIDEAGRARAPRVQGAELPGLGSCLSTVTSKLVSQAPDTGVVHATIVLNFAP